MPEEASKTARSITQAMIALKARFDNDLDRALIYMVLMQPMPCAGDVLGFERGVNALSITEITGIPRETTRRKLRQMVASEWVVCGADGLWRLKASPEGIAMAEDLAALAQALVMCRAVG